jgi:hypothetical protein
VQLKEGVVGAKIKRNAMLLVGKDQAKSRMSGTRSRHQLNSWAIGLYGGMK